MGAKKLPMQGFGTVRRHGFGSENVTLSMGPDRTSEDENLMTICEMPGPQLCKRRHDPRGTPKQLHKTGRDKRYRLN